VTSGTEQSIAFSNNGAHLADAINANGGFPVNHGHGGKTIVAHHDRALAAGNIDGQYAFKERFGLVSFFIYPIKIQ
jgi:hypothetical protein